MACGILRRGHNDMWHVEMWAQWHMANWDMGTMAYGKWRRGHNGMWHIETWAQWYVANRDRGHNDIWQTETVGTMAKWDVGTMARDILRLGHNDTRALADWSCRLWTGEKWRVLTALPRTVSQLAIFLAGDPVNCFLPLVQEWFWRCDTERCLLVWKKSYAADERLNSEK